MFNLFKSKKEEPKELKAFLGTRFEYAPVTAVNTNIMMHSLIDEGSSSLLQWLKKPVVQFKSVN